MHFFHQNSPLANLKLLERQKNLMRVILYDWCATIRLLWAYSIQYWLINKRYGARKKKITFWHLPIEIPECRCTRIETVAYTSLYHLQREVRKSCILSKEDLFPNAISPMKTRKRNKISQFRWKSLKAAHKTNLGWSHFNKNPRVPEKQQDVPPKTKKGNLLQRKNCKTFGNLN